MDYQQKTLADYVALLNRRKVWLFGTASAILVVSILVALILPPVYQSSATILIEQQEIPTELVQSTVTSYADQRLQVINQRVMTRTNLLEIIQKYDLYGRDRARGVPMETIFDNMRDDISLDMVSADVIDPRSGRPTQATIAFTLAYQNRNPGLAQAVANELTSLFLNENVRTRTRQAAEASDFLTDEVKRLGVLVSELEAKLATFKEENVGSLPEMVQMNQQLMDRTERELNEVDRQIQTLKERKIYLTSELAGLNPYSTMYSQDGERVLSPVDRLKMLQTKYISMSAVYGPDLPDLVKLRKEISALKAEVGTIDNASEMEARLISRRSELNSARQKYSDEHPFTQRLAKEVAMLEQEVHKQAMTQVDNEEKPATTPDNPAYLQTQAQLDSAASELRATEQKADKLRAKLALYENRIVQTPQVEREYRRLSRDYDNAQLKYKELRAKQMQAQLSESLESESKGERFTMIEPPQLPEKPLKPNRLALLFLGFIFAIGGGIGVSILRDNMDSAIHGMMDIVQITKMSPIAVVSFIPITDEQEQTRKLKVMYAIAAGVALIVLILIVHFAVKPLDVLWFVLMRRFGM